jgi:hypothetical protein
VKADDADFVEQHLNAAQGITVHPASRRAIAAMPASRLYFPLLVTEGIRTPSRIALDMR